MHLITVEDISKEEEGRTLVNNVRFSIDAFKKVALMGETGSGKSTVMKMMGGLVQASHQPITGTSAKAAGYI